MKVPAHQHFTLDNGTQLILAWSNEWAGNE